VLRKCSPYMGALAAAGCAWSACGDPCYGAMRSGRGWLGTVVAWQAAGCNKWCVSTGGFLALQSQRAIVACLIYGPHALAEGN